MLLLLNTFIGIRAIADAMTGPMTGSGLFQIN